MQSVSSVDTIGYRAGDLFPANMVDVGGKRNTLQTKVLTSQLAKESGTVDPKAQITAEEAKGKEPQ